MSKKPLSFEERVLSMVRNLAEYGTYGKNIGRAVKLLHRHHPEVPLRECNSHFTGYLNAYREAIDFVGLHREFYREQYDTKNFFGTNENSPEESAFIGAHENVPARIINGMIGWIFFRHHLK